jgi:hypothetical protein
VSEAPSDASLDAVFPDQSRYAMLADFVPALTQLVAHLRAPMAGLVLGVDGANLGEQPLVRALPAHRILASCRA